jgi:hypothetical protein
MVDKFNTVPDHYPAMPAVIRCELVKLFEDDTDYVEALLSRDLTDWRKPQS